MRSGRGFPIHRIVSGSKQIWTSSDHLEQWAEADRREVDPPIQVETAALSKAGHLDW